MNAWMRNGSLLGLGFLLVAMTGCSLGSLAYFLTPEQKHEAELCKLTSPDSKFEPSVVILTMMTNPIARTELIGVDRELGELAAVRLYELLQANKERVRILAPRKIEEYKSRNSDWEDKQPAEIGKHFSADYVIVLEINRLTLFEKGSSSELFRGQVEMRITLVDVHNPDYTPKSQTLSCVWPDAAKAVSVDNELSPRDFREAFLKHLATRVAYKFAAHSRQESYHRGRKFTLGVD